MSTGAERKGEAAETVIFLVWLVLRLLTSLQ